MSFEFFHERLPWQPNLTCNLHKKLHICNQNIVFNIHIKNKLSSSKDSCIRNVASFFPTLPPPHSRSVYDLIGMILAILYIARCPIWFMQNISLIGIVDLEKKSFECFLLYMGMAAILNFES